MPRRYIIPKREMEFAAKSVFLTRGLWEEFFNPHTEGWASIRWRGFKSRKLFVDHSSSLARDCLIVKKIVDSEISSPPLALQIPHDEIVGRIVLKLLSHDLIEKKYYLEPELRRIYQEHGLNWRRDRLKLPDALFDLKTAEGKILSVALEVELNKKSQSRYRKIIECYSSNEKIKKVIIVYRGNEVKSSFKQALTRYGYPQSIRPLFFVGLEKFFHEDNFLHFFKNIR